MEQKKEPKNHVNYSMGLILLNNTILWVIACITKMPGKYIYDAQCLQLTIFEQM